MDKISRLSAWIEAVPRQFHCFSQEEALCPRPGGRWSRLQILGHLCDSAVHNLSRFIQAVSQPGPLIVTPYNQEAWVEAQQYGSAPMEEVLQLWVSLNQSVLRVISHISPVKLSSACLLPNGSTVSLEWLIDDYIRHLEHHLEQIFDVE